MTCIIYRDVPDPDSTIRILLQTANGKLENSVVENSEINDKLLLY